MLAISQLPVVHPARIAPTPEDNASPAANKLPDPCLPNAAWETRDGVMILTLPNARPIDYTQPQFDVAAHEIALLE
ncbi:MAG: hypothetical protein JWO69_1525 [Thermoleophilia bacterium]|nr:hypothetical protein [Thermoleophilia bacterium]